MTEPEHKASVMPIAIALGVVAVVLIVMVVSRLIKGDDIPDVDQVGRSVVAQNDALQRENYPDFRRSTCAAQQGAESQVLDEQRKSKAAKGNRFVDDVKDITVSGERATATAVYHFEKSPDDKISTPMTFVRENDVWTVCSPGPR